MTDKLSPFQKMNETLAKQNGLKRGECTVIIGERKGFISDFDDHMEMTKATEVGKPVTNHANTLIEMQVIGELKVPARLEAHSKVLELSKNRNFIFFSREDLEALVKPKTLVNTMKSIVDADWGKMKPMLHNQFIQIGTVIKDETCCDILLVMNSVGEKTVYMHVSSKAGKRKVAHSMYFSTAGRYVGQWDTVVTLGIPIDALLNPIKRVMGQWSELTI